MQNDLIIRANIKKPTKCWMVDISGEYTFEIANYLKNSISSDGVRNIISTSAKILGYCPNPSDDKNELLTGLLMGKVQSGKTSAFITTVALSFDNGYDIAIILAGTKTTLLRQNTERINEYFNNTDTVVLNAGSDGSEIKPDKIRNFIELGKKVIIVTLKHQTWTEKLKVNLLSDKYISSKPILIIDDEGDEHTLNNDVSNKSMSSNYKEIIGMRSMCKKAAFLSVTATPQANIIINTLDALSPDFTVLIPPGDGYCGLDTFHEPNSKYCIEIPETENSLLDNEGVPKSFYDALSSFFIAAYVYHKRKGKKSKFSMLVHPSRIVNDISSVSSVTDNILNYWRKLINNRKDIEFESLRDILENAYNSYRNNGVYIEPFKDILDDVLLGIRNCGLHEITGGKDLDGRDKNYDNNIYIGGDMVGRGLTFKGLTITYIIRSAKGVSNIDTVQQRARWFGYKESYLDLCRIYATKKIIRNFEDIKVHEEALWQTIKAYNLEGENFKNMERFFVTSDDLRPTRKSVGETCDYKFSLWTTENRFIDSQSMQNHNMQIIDKLFSDFEHKINIENYGGTQNKVIRELDFEDIYKNYLSEFLFATNARVDRSFFSTLLAAVKYNNVKPKCDIVWPRYNVKNGCQEIDVDDSGKIGNFMVGHSKRDENGNEVYKGDRYVMTEKSIEIQLHNILGKNGETSMSLAVYVPPSYVGGRYVTTY